VIKTTLKLLLATSAWRLSRDNAECTEKNDSMAMVQNKKNRSNEFSRICNLVLIFKEDL